MTASQALLNQYLALRPADVARRVERFTDADAAAVIATAGDDEAVALLQHLSPPTAARGLASLETERAAGLLDAMPRTVAASLVRRLDRDAAERLLGALPARRAEPLRRQLSYGPETAGGVMDPLVEVVPFGATAADARALIDAHPAHLYYYVYVVDDEHRLAGVFDLAELMQAAPSAAVSSFMRTDVVGLPAETPLEAVFRHPAWRDLDALPVLGPDRRFLGVLRHRRMRQLAEDRQPPGRDEHTVRTLLALGEIYWLGLCGLLQGIATTATAPSTPREPS